MPIYVETDQKQYKLFDAKLAGEVAAQAETKMQEMVKNAADKAAGFTTAKDQNSKGYFVRLKLSKVEKVGGDTKCEINGELVRYPKEVTKSHGSGAAMVSTSWYGKAQASGRDAIMMCVEAIVEKMLPNGFTAMSSDMLKR